MDLSKIYVSVTGPDLQTKEQAFSEPARLLIGRAEDCDLRLSNSFGAGQVSRHHCVLEVEPPLMRIRDLGSLNGTFVNGDNIGQRPYDQDREEADLQSFPWVELHPGDVVRIGHTTLHVAVTSMEEVEKAKYSASGVLWL